MGPIKMNTNVLDSVMTSAIKLSVEEEAIINSTDHTTTPLELWVCTEYPRFNKG